MQLCLETSLLVSSVGSFFSYIWHSLPVHNFIQPEDVLTRAETCSYAWVFGNKGAASDAMYWYLYA